MLSWLVTEKVRHGHPTSLGAASGAVAGLVAITPVLRQHQPLAALGLGLVAGAACAVFVDLKFKFGFDDSLDVVGVHLGAGLIGTLALGFIALPVDGAGGGLFYGGGLQQVIAQTVAVLITVALSGLGTAVIGLAIHKTIGFRVSPRTNSPESTGPSTPRPPTSSARSRRPLPSASPACPGAATATATAAHAAPVPSAPVQPEAEVQAEAVGGGPGRRRAREGRRLDQILAGQTQLGRLLATSSRTCATASRAAAPWGPGAAGSVEIDPARSANLSQSPPPRRRARSGAKTAGGPAQPHVRFTGPSVQHRLSTAPALGVEVLHQQQNNINGQEVDQGAQPGCPDKAFNARQVRVQ